MFLGLVTKSQQKRPKGRKKPHFDSFSCFGIQKHPRSYSPLFRVRVGKVQSTHILGFYPKKMLQDMCSISSNFLVLWISLSILGLFTILISSSLAFYYYYINITFEKWQHKINPEYPTPQKVRDEIVLMLKGIVFSALCPALSIYMTNRNIWTKAYCTFSDDNIYTWQYHILQFVGIVLVSDGYEWYYHRLGHTVKICWDVHRHHHVFYNPTPFSVISDEFIDQFVRALPLVVFPLVTPINMELLFFTYSMFFYFYGVYLHSGHEITLLNAHHPIFNTSYQHYIHHAKSIYKKPYHTGFYFKIWDQLVGSIYPKSKCDCITCQLEQNGPRTKEQYAKVVKPDYSILWKDFSIWWDGTVKYDTPNAQPSQN